MVYSDTYLRHDFRGSELALSTGQVLDELGITKITLYKWISMRTIKARRHKIGNRIFLSFDAQEVERVKSTLIPKKDRVKYSGKSLLKE